MRLQDRRPEFRRVVRDSLVNGITEKASNLWLSFFIDWKFIGYVQTNTPGVFWQAPEGGLTIDSLPKIAEHLSGIDFKTSSALAILLPSKITEFKGSPVPSDFRRQIIENSMNKIDFLNDLIDTFFNHNFWGDKLDRRNFFEYFPWDLMKDAFDLFSKLNTEAELVQSKETVNEAMSFIEAHRFSMS